MRLDKLARQLKTQGREQKRSGKHLATRLRQSDRVVRPQDQIRRRQVLSAWSRQRRPSIGRAERHFRLDSVFEGLDLN